MSIVTGLTPQLLCSLKAEPKSVYGLSQELDVPEAKLRATLIKLEQKRYVKKEEKKYRLQSDVILLNGIIFIFDSETGEFVLFSCKHFDSKCKCKKSVSKSCQKLKELMENKLFTERYPNYNGIISAYLRANSIFSSERFK